MESQLAAISCLIANEANQPNYSKRQETLAISVYKLAHIWKGSHTRSVLLIFSVPLELSAVHWSTMVSSKIHCAMAALLLAILLPVSHASGRYVAPAPAPVPVPPPPRTSPPSRIQPVVVVQGTIYCKSCNLSGYNRYMDASPLPS